MYYFVLDEEDSLVHGIVTKEGLFDGTIFSKNEIYYVEPVSRYTPSIIQHQNSTSMPNHIHTIIYKTTDVKIPPSLKTSCASQFLYLSRTNSEPVKKRTKRFLGSDDDFSENPTSVDLVFKKFPKIAAISETGKSSAVLRHSHGNIKNGGASSLPFLNSHNDILDSSILKTFTNSHEETRTRKKVNDSFVVKYPKTLTDGKTMINRPKILVNKPDGKENMNKDQDLDEVLPNGTLKHVIKRATIDPKKTTCMLYLQADHLFYQKYGTEEACIEVMTRHVQRVNSIYRNTGKQLNREGRGRFYRLTTKCVVAKAFCLIKTFLNVKCNGTISSPK